MSTVQEQPKSDKVTVTPHEQIARLFHAISWDFPMGDSTALCMTDVGRKEVWEGQGAINTALLRRFILRLNSS